MGLDRVKRARRHVHWRESMSALAVPVGARANPNTVQVSWAGVGLDVALTVRWGAGGGGASDVQTAAESSSSGGALTSWLTARVAAAAPESPFALDPAAIPAPA